MRILFQLSVVAFVFGFAGLETFGSEDLEQEFREVAPVEWEKLQSFLGKVRGSAEQTQFHGEEKLSSRMIEFMVNGGSQRAVTTSPDSTDTRAFACCRSHLKNYSFSLSKDSPSEGFVVRALDTYDPDISMFKYSSGHDGMYRSLQRFLNAPFVIEYYFLPMMHKSPGFKVLEVSAANERPDDLVEVRFEYESPSPELKSSLKNGIAVFSRSNHWAMTSFSAEASWGGLSGEIEYEEDGANGFRFPRSVHHKLWAGTPFKSELHDNEAYKFVGLKTFEAPSEEFTLAAFGIAEVLNESGKKSYIPVLVAVLLCITLLTLIVRQKGQK